MIEFTQLDQQTLISKNYAFTDIADVTGLSELDLQKLSKTL